MAVATVAALAGLPLFDRLLERAGRADLTQVDSGVPGYILAIAGSTAVGAVLAVRRPRHPVGWLFLALGLTIAGSGLLDSYSLYGAVARPGRLPAADWAAVLGDMAWIWWFVLVTLVLHLTPTGRPLWRLPMLASPASALLWIVTVLLWPGPLDPPRDGIRSPLALPASYETVLGPVRLATAIVVGAALVVAGVSLLVRFHRSRGQERRRLLWLAIAVVPLPVFVVTAFLASPDHPVLLSLATGGFICLVPVAAGLSIARYHLYDVENVLSKAVTYVLVSAVLAVTFALVTGTAGRLIGDDSLTAVLATLGAVTVAAPAYRAFQEQVDRRFNRRRFDTIRTIREHVREPRTDVETVLREALGDPGLLVAYWVAGRGQWVTAGGRAVEPVAEDIEVLRSGRPVARVSFDERVVSRELAETAVAEATPALESAGLRAEIAVQLTEVRESRARIAAAQTTERRRIERDLHDGAQQRLLALAMQLEAAQVNGDPARLREVVAAGIGEARAAVAELRELANGLHPAVLGDSGLAAALDDLAARLPLDVRLNITLDGPAGAPVDGLAATPMVGPVDRPGGEASDGVLRRFPAQVEATAWFIACEAISNAVKHSGSTRLDVGVRTEDGQLVVSVADDGTGGADPDGGGLRGIADRAEAAGGSLTVETRAGGGTVVTGRLPCGS